MSFVLNTLSTLNGYRPTSMMKNHFPSNDNWKGALFNAVVDTAIVGSGIWGMGWCVRNAAEGIQTALNGSTQKSLEVTLVTGEPLDETMAAPTSPTRKPACSPAVFAENNLCNDTVVTAVGYDSDGVRIGAWNLTVPAGRNASLNLSDVPAQLRSYANSFSGDQGYGNVNALDAPGGAPCVSLNITEEVP